MCAIGYRQYRYCRVEISIFTVEDSLASSLNVFLCEKRDSTGHGGVAVDREWKTSSRVLCSHKGEVENKF
ncbi:hypothetical protein Tco_1377649 [Tanacetum coccineum]